MHPYSFKTKSHNRLASILFATLATLTLLILFLSILIEDYRYLIASVSLFSGSGAIWVYIRYIFTFFIYEIYRDDLGTNTLSVVKILGQKSIVQMRISLIDIACISKQNSKDIKNHKSDKNISKYSYMQTILPNKRLYLRYNNEYEIADVFLESDDEFDKILLSLTK